MMVNHASILLYPCKIFPFDLLWDISATSIFGLLGHMVEYGLPNGLPTKIVVSEWRTMGWPYRGGPIMPLKSYNWARIDVKWPNARVVTFGGFEIMAPKSTCPMLTRQEVTSIKALCQVVYPFGCLDFYNHTLYSQVAFRQMVHFSSTITFGWFFLSTSNTSGLQSLHYWWSTLKEVAFLLPQHSLLSI